jgi:hypothetical protein
MKFKLLILALVFAMIAAAQSVHSVTLNWVAPTSGGQVTGYNIYRSLTSGTYTTSPLASVSGMATTTYTDLSGTGNVLVEGTTYYYVVTSTGPGGESVHSPEASGKIPFFLPSPPTGLSVSAK